MRVYLQTTVQQPHSIPVVHPCFKLIYHNHSRYSVTQPSTTLPPTMTHQFQIWLCVAEEVLLRHIYFLRRRLQDLDLGVTSVHRVLPLQDLTHAPRLSVRVGCVCVCVCVCVDFGKEDVCAWESTA